MSVSESPRKRNGERDGGPGLSRKGLQNSEFEKVVYPGLRYDNSEIPKMSGTRGVWDGAAGGGRRGGERSATAEAPPLPGVLRLVKLCCPSEVLACRTQTRASGWVSLPEAEFISNRLYSLPRKGAQRLWR